MDDELGACHYLYTKFFHFRPKLDTNRSIWIIDIHVRTQAIASNDQNINTYRNGGVVWV